MTEPETPETPQKLTRSRDDRYIGGVAAGIAERFSIDPALVRIAFVLSLAFGGFGAIAYLILLVMLPIGGDPSEPVEPVKEGRRNRDKILDVTRRSLEALGYWPLPAEGGAARPRPGRSPGEDSRGRGSGRGPHRSDRHRRG